MEKTELLQSLGFTSEFLDHLSDFEKSQSDFIKKDTNTLQVEIKSFDTHNLVINNNCQSGISNYIIK